MSNLRHEIVPVRLEPTGVSRLRGNAKPEAPGDPQAG